MGVIDVVLLSGEQTTLTPATINSAIQSTTADSASATAGSVDKLLQHINRWEVLVGQRQVCWRFLHNGEPLEDTAVSTLGQAGDDTLLALTIGAGTTNSVVPSPPPCVMERCTHKVDFLPTIPSSPKSSPQRTRSNTGESFATAVPEGEDSLPYLASCRLVVALSDPNTFATVERMVTTVESEIAEKRRAEEEAKAALAANSQAVADEEPPSAEDLEPMLLSLVPPEAISTLTEFGFGHDAIIRCLVECNMNPDEALNKLLSVDDASVFNTPLSEEEVLKYSRRYGLCPDPAAGGASTKLTSGGQRRGKPMDPKVAQLVDMGFSEDEVTKTLRLAQGNAEVAAAALLGDTSVLDALQQRQNQNWWSPLEEDLRSEVFNASDVLSVIRRLHQSPNSAGQLWCETGDGERDGSFPFRPVLKRLCGFFSNNLMADV